MIYINKEHNSLVITPKEFKENYNYLPDIVFALGDLKARDVKIAICLEKTPAVFVLYFRKIQQETGVTLDIYYTEKAQNFKQILKGYGMPYKSIKKYPDVLPEE